MAADASEHHGMQVDDMGSKPPSPPPPGTWRDWYVPLARGDLTLRQALDSAKAIRAQQGDIPLIIKLIENPDYRLPGLKIFNGAVTLDDHDCIHALLGRGLLPKDEAFTIGYTMGSTKRVGDAEFRLYSLAAKHLYPRPYRFTDEDIQVYECALRLGCISRCQPLDLADYDPLLDLTLVEARRKLGIEEDLLAAYYRIEQARYPHVTECQRLL